MRGQAGVAGNECADAIANFAARGVWFGVDEAYEAQLKGEAAIPAR